MIAVRRGALLAVSAVYGWWVTSLRPFTRGATVVVLATGVAALACGLRRRRSDHDAARTTRVRGLAWWALLAAVLLGWELLSYAQHPRAQHPTLSSMTNAALDLHALRAAAFVGWIAVTTAIARQ